MKTYARIQDGRVAALVTTAAGIETLYHPSLHWIDVSAVHGVAVGWDYDGTHCSRPKDVAKPSAEPSLAELQARLAQLSAEIKALSASA